MKAFFKKIKTAILAVVDWFAKWPKDLVLHFHLADNIFAMAWLGTTVIFGCFSDQKWAGYIAAALTLGFILIKDLLIDDRADWKDIVAGIIGMVWSIAKVWLLTMVWRWLWMQPFM